MRRTFEVRRLVGAVAAVTAAGAGAVTVSAPAAVAAAGCVKADQYAHHPVSPASISGGVDVSGAKFGAAAAIGDFDHDGFADVAIGAPGDVVGGQASGAVYVFRGTASGIDTTAGVRLTESNVGAGNEAGDQFGAALAAGDFDHDGFADLAVGIPGEAIGSKTKSGAIAVFLGKSSGLTTGDFIDQSLGDASDEAGDRFGTSLAAGDVNGDGFDDLAIGVPGEAPHGGTVHSGLVFLYKGTSAGLAKGWGIDQETIGGGGNESGDEFGAAVAIGNVTGDSHADVVVGAPGEAPGDDPADSGSIYVALGSATGPKPGFADTQAGDGGTNEAGDRLGAAVAVGDFDNDGRDDVAAGIPGESPGANPKSGAVLVFPGASSSLAHGFWLDESHAGESRTAGDKFGASLAAGDVNGDGHDDLLVGAPGKSYGSHTGAGATFLFIGGPRAAGSTVAMTLGRRIGQTDVAAGNEAGDAFGSAVALGDVTGDGRADAVIGDAGEATPGQPASGTATQLTDLAAPTGAALPVQSFAPMAALQASPIPNATLGAVEYAYTDNIGRLVFGHQSDPDNALSVQWQVISGLDAYTGQPALAEQADGRLQVVDHNIDGSMHARIEATKDPAAWQDWVTTLGQMASRPTLVRQSDGTVVGFAVDAAGNLWALPQSGVNGVYTSWVSLGVGGLAGAPAAVDTADGVKVFARDSTGAVVMVSYAADRLATECVNLGGTGLTGTPSVVRYPGSRLRVFARAADGTIVTQTQDTAGAWPGTWQTVGTFTAAGSPSALLDPRSGKTELVALGADGGIYGTGETVQGSGQWRDWELKSQFGDFSATDPVAFELTNSNGTGWAFVFRNSDNVVRVYTLNTGLGALARTSGQSGESGQTGPVFQGHSLPAPPGA